MHTFTGKNMAAISGSRGVDKALHGSLNALARATKTPGETLKVTLSLPKSLS